MDAKIKETILNPILKGNPSNSRAPSSWPSP